jgi:DNA-binding NarL/FixJ family response regulator
MNTSITIWILDDHPLYAKGLADLLEEMPKLEVNTRLFHQSKVFLEALTETLPDLVFLDINLPVINGLEISKYLHKTYPQLKFIGLSSHNELKVIKEFMKAGSMGYLLKTINDTELYSCIDIVLNGSIYLAEEVKSVLINTTLNKSESKGYLKPKLTPREKEVLTLIINEQTTAQIAAQLFLSEATIETHRMNLFQKLSVKNVAGLVREAYEHKLLDE